MYNGKNRGRPPVKPPILADGFYIEIRNLGSSDKRVKIKSLDKESMQKSAALYRRSKEVVILGEYKHETWITD
ncbi:MAG: hypothetical protein H7X71_01805 [Chitinophagales bacterium]|nr:hypothetical protein [Chitinophagales bacterium]